MWRVFILLGFSLPAMAATPVCHNTTPASVLLELFTSEGCSSCPPADAWLAKVPLKFNPDQVISLAWHVDYWDYLGWKDVLANPQFSLRQRERVRVSNSQNVYTPQLMINGQTHIWHQHAEQLIQQALTQPYPQLLQVSAQQQSPDSWLLDIKTTTDLPNTTVLRAALTGETVNRKIGGGENAGRMLSHPSPVLAYAPLAQGKVTLNTGDHKAVRAVVWLEGMHASEVISISSVDLVNCH